MVVLGGGAVSYGRGTPVLVSTTTSSCYFYFVRPPHGRPPHHFPFLSRIQGYLAPKKAPPLGPTGGLCLGAYAGPRGGARFLMSEVPL